MAGSLALAAVALSPGGLGIIDLALLALFAITLPWTVAGFWNAVIGFLIMRFSADPIAAVMPVMSRIQGDEPLTASTAILLCIRNEPPERVIRNLEPMLAGLDLSGYGKRFALYVLSDSSDASIASGEEACFAALSARWGDRVPITYRRRVVNTGYKAGNIREFCERWGSKHEFAVTLDADSFMTADAILRLVRIMQADPKLGILQGVPGGPALDGKGHVIGVLATMNPAVALRNIRWNRYGGAANLASESEMSRHEEIASKCDTSGPAEFRRPCQSGDHSYGFQEI